MKMGQITADGRTYPIRYPDSPQMEAVMAGIFSNADYPRLDLLAGTDGAIVDIGANIGCTALLFRLQYPNAPIFAFEPASESYEYLAENASQLPRVRTFHHGLFDRDATTTLHLGHDVSVTNSIAESVYNGDGSEEIVLRRVSTVLDELAIHRIALLKIDTEGSEIPILRDLEPRFDRIEAIFVEYHSERDRLEIDRLLSERFTLYFSHATRPHLGTIAYLAKDVLATRTDAARFEIVRPRL
jgi:FkbM family methyltransferase